MLRQLITILQSSKLDISAQEIADSLWLARYLASNPGSRVQATADHDLTSVQPVPGSELAQPLEPVATPAPLSTPLPTPPLVPQEQHEALHRVTYAADLFSEPQHDQRDDEETPSFAAPEAPALTERLAIARALRPLLRRVPSRITRTLDEETTVARIADADLWVPAIRPAPERWLDVAVVVDGAHSLQVWHQTIQEFYQLLVRHGAFRHVQLWTLTAKDAHLQLHAGLAQLAGERSARNPDILQNREGRLIVLVITDAAASYWWTGAARELVCSWGRRQPVALVQVLPEILWDRTALGAFVDTVVRAPRPAAPNGDLRTERVVREGHNGIDNSMAFPVLTFEPEVLARWAALVAGQGDACAYAALLDSRTLTLPPAPQELSSEQLVQRFLMTASPIAVRLAGLLTGASPVTMRVMRVIQHALLPDSGQAHLAEVLLSGILHRIDPPELQREVEDIRYDFPEPVRAQLRSTVPTPDWLAALEIVGATIGLRYGLGRDFTAWLRTTNLDADDERLPFARLVSRELAHLPGNLGALAQVVRLRVEDISGSKPAEEPGVLTSPKQEDRPTPDAPPMPEAMVLTMLDQVQQAEHRIMNLAERLLSIADRIMLLTIARNLKQELEQLQQGAHSTVAFTGEVNRGKSTLINAVLGKELLPADIMPATATVVRVVDGERPSARIIYRRKDGVQRLPEEISIEHLAEYTTKITPEAKVVAAEVQEVIVLHPNIYGRYNIDLVDTPGIGDDETMRTVSVSVASEAAVVVLVLMPDRPFSDYEVEFITSQLPFQYLDRLVCVVNAIDRIRPSDRDRVMQMLEKRRNVSLERRLSEQFGVGTPEFEAYLRRMGQVPVFSLSGWDALEAKKSRDSSRLSASGLPLFEQELDRRMAAERARKLAVRVEALTRLANQLLEVLAGQPPAGSTLSQSEIGTVVQEVNLIREQFQSEQIILSEWAVYKDIVAPVQQEGDVEVQRMNAESELTAREEVEFQHRNLETIFSSDWARLLEIAVRAKVSPNIIRAGEQAHAIISGRRFCIAFVGEFNRGKSTLLNALLGSEVFPEIVLPENRSRVNRVVYGFRPTVTLVRRGTDGAQSVESEEMSLKQFLTYPVNVTSHIEQTILKYPLPLFQNEVEITEFNLSENGFKGITSSSLAEASVVVLVLSASVPFNLNERDCLLNELLPASAARITILVTGMDRIPKAEDRKRVLQYFRDRIPKLVDEHFDAHGDRIDPVEYQRLKQKADLIQVYGLSGYQALRARLSYDVNLLQESGILAFEQSLKRLLAEERGEVTRQVWANHTIALGSIVAEQLHIMYGAVAGDEHEQQVLRKLEQELEEMRRKAYSVFGLDALPSKLPTYRTSSHYPALPDPVVVATQLEVASDYRTTAFAFQSHFLKIRQLADEMALPDLYREIERFRSLSEDGVFKIGVVGEFKRGKSVLINALLGQEIVYTDVLPTKLPAVTIKYGGIPRATVVYSISNSTQSPRVVPLIEIEALWGNLNNAEDIERQVVQEVIISYPSSFCRNNVEIIDTPGLNDDAFKTTTTEAILPELSAAIMVLTPESPLGSYEAEFLVNLLDQSLAHIMIVVTGMDRVRRIEDRHYIVKRIADRIQSSVRTYLQERFGGPEAPEYELYRKKIGFRVFAVSGLDALQAKEENDQQSLAESGFPEFETALEQLLIRERGRLQLIVMAQRLIKVCQSLLLRLQATESTPALLQREQIIRDSITFARQIINSVLAQG